VLTDNAPINDDAGRKQLSIHRLTQEAAVYGTYGLIDSSSLQHAFDGLLSLLRRRFPHAELHEGLWSRWGECSKYLPHVAALARASKRCWKKKKSAAEPVETNTVFVNLLIDATWYLQEIGELQECLDLLDIAKDACPDRNSLEYAYLCNTHVTVAVDQNDIAMGRKYSQEALAIRKAWLPPNHMDLAASHNNYANSLNNEGRYDEAIEHLLIAEKSGPERATRTSSTRPWPSSTWAGRSP
jgi:tetratricopeptide (TPR) repeat protein